MGTGNTVQGNGNVTGGIILNDMYAALSWGVSGVMANGITLNGGTLQLDNDLKFVKGHLKGSGTIDLKNNHLIMHSLDHAMVDSLTIKGNIGVISPNSNITLSDTWTIDGTVIIDGSGHVFDLSDIGEIVVASDAHLILRNVIMRNVGGTNIRCIDDTGLITLDNMQWHQEEDFTFVSGALEINNAVRMYGKTTFSYQSTKNITIKTQSSLRLYTDFIFCYEPIDLSKNLLVFEDSTAQLVLSSATLQTTNGIDLVGGKLRIKGNSYFYPTDNVITLGDGTTTGDCICGIIGGSKLTIKKGALAYKNVDQDSWIMTNNVSLLYMSSGTTLQLYQPLDLGIGILRFCNNTTLARASGVQLTGSIDVAGNLKYGTV